MKKLLLLFTIWIGMQGISYAQATYPEQGKKLHFNFNNSLKDIVNGVEFVPDEQTKAQFTETGEDQNQALAGKGTYKLSYNVSRAEMPQRTFVVRLKINDASSIGYSIFLSTYKAERGSVSILSFAQGKAKVQIKGKSSKESERDRRIYEEIPTGEYTYYIMTSDMESGISQLAADTECYTYFDKYNGLGMEEDKGFDKLVINIPEGTDVDEMLVYNRVLTLEEMEAIVGKKISVHEPSEMEKDTTSFNFFFLIHLALIGWVVYQYVQRKKQRIAPITLQSMAAYPMSGNKEKAREDAWKYMEEAHQCWNWHEDAETNEFVCEYPKNAKALKVSRQAFDKALQTGCTDEDLMYEYNEYAAIYNHANGYVFNGWIPFVLMTIVALMCSPLFTGGDWSSLLNWRTLGYWIALISYIAVSLCPRYIAYRGQEVEEPRKLADQMANLAGYTMDGIAKGGAFVGQVLNKGFNLLDWCLKNSVTHYKVFRNGTHIGNTTEMNPTGIITFVVVIAIIIALLIIAYTILMIMLSCSAIYKFIRNYIICK